MFIKYLVCFSCIRYGEKEHRIFEVTTCTTEIDKIEKAFIDRYSSEYNNLEVLNISEERWINRTHL